MEVAGQIVNSAPHCSKEHDTFTAFKR